MSCENGIHSFIDVANIRFVERSLSFQSLTRRGGFVGDENIFASYYSKTAKRSEMKAAESAADEAMILCAVC
jgi:hypothetical protein